MELVPPPRPSTRGGKGAPRLLSRSLVMHYMTPLLCHSSEAVLCDASSPWRVDHSR